VATLSLPPEGSSAMVTKSCDDDQIRGRDRRWGAVRQVLGMVSGVSAKGEPAEG